MLDTILVIENFVIYFNCIYVLVNEVYANLRHLLKPIRFNINKMK